MALICSATVFGAPTVTFSSEPANGGKLIPGEETQINIYMTTSEDVDVYGVQFDFESSDLTLVADKEGNTAAKASLSPDFKDMTLGSNTDTGIFMIYSVGQNYVKVNGKVLVCTISATVSETASESVTLNLNNCVYVDGKGGEANATKSAGNFSSTLPVETEIPVTGITIATPSRIRQALLRSS